MRVVNGSAFHDTYPTLARHVRSQRECRPLRTYPTLIYLNATGQQPCVPCLGQPPCTVWRCAVVTIMRDFTVTVATARSSMVLLSYGISCRSVPIIIIYLDATGQGMQITMPRMLAKFAAWHFQEAECQSIGTATSAPTLPVVPLVLRMRRPSPPSAPPQRGYCHWVYMNQW